MRNYIPAACAAVIMFSAIGTAQAADADSGIYARLDSGWSFSRDAGKDVNDDAGSSPIAGAGIGYRLNQYLRGDVTLGYRWGYEVDTNTTVLSNTVNWKGDVSSLAGMANAYVDVAKVGIFTPYVGGGVGLSHNKAEDADVTVSGVTGKLKGDSTTEFAWQLSAGVGVQLAPKLTLDVGYRYMDMGEAKSGDTITIGGATSNGWTSRGDLTAHEIQAGIRYQF